MGKYDKGNDPTYQQISSLQQKVVTEVTDSNRSSNYLFHFALKQISEKLNQLFEKKKKKKKNRFIFNVLIKEDEF